MAISFPFAIMTLKNIQCISYLPFTPVLQFIISISCEVFLWTAVFFMKDSNLSISAKFRVIRACLLYEFKLGLKSRTWLDFILTATSSKALKMSAATEVETSAVSNCLSTRHTEEYQDFKLDNREGVSHFQRPFDTAYRRNKF